MAQQADHATKLALAALVQRHPQPTGPPVGLAGRPACRKRLRRLPQQYDLGRRGRAIVQHHAVLQPPDLARVGEPCHLHQIGLRMLVARVGQPVSEPAIVGEQEQALAVLVQPADGEEPLRRLDELLPGRVFGAPVRAGQIPGRLVQHDVTMPLADHRPAIHADFRHGRVHFDPQLSDHPAGDGDTPRDDDLFTCPARAQAGARQDLLKSFFWHKLFSIYKCQGPCHTVNSVVASTWPSNIRRRRPTGKVLVNGMVASSRRTGCTNGHCQAGKKMSGAAAARRR